MKTIQNCLTTIDKKSVLQQELFKGRRNPELCLPSTKPPGCNVPLWKALLRERLKERIDECAALRSIAVPISNIFLPFYSIPGQIFLRSGPILIIIHNIPFSIHQRKCIATSYIVIFFCIFTHTAFCMKLVR